MKDVVGSPGTRGGLALRLSQFVCAAGSVAAMSSAYGSSNYTAFCIRLFRCCISFWQPKRAGNADGINWIVTAFFYLVFQMTLQLAWSFVLICIDILSLKTNWDLHSAENLWKYVIGDWILSMGSMAAASSSTGVAILLETDSEFCEAFPYASCSRYKVSVILASMAWSFMAASACSTFWLLVSLSE